MIQRSPALWQQELAQAVTDPAELLRILGLDPALLPAARQAAALFPLRVPRYFIGRMRHGDPDDPLLRQVLPLGEELLDHPGFVTDPVGDHAADQGGGILRKYHGRALLITTGACAVHCRYCFRRHFPYTELSLGRSGLATTLDRLAAVPELTEVILSGGDPLTLSDQRLGELLAGIAALPRLRRLRIHTRLPVCPRPLGARRAGPSGRHLSTWSRSGCQPRPRRPRSLPSKRAPPRWRRSTTSCSRCRRSVAWSMREIRQASRAR